MFILKVALPVPLRRTFDYLPPVDLADGVANCQAGIRVMVSFGNQQLIGLLLGVSQHTDVPIAQLKPVLQILDEQPCLPAEMLAFCQWAAGYYHCPLGEALATALPSAIRQGAPIELPAEKNWRLTTAGQGLPEGALKRAKKQAQVLEILQQQSRLSDTQRKVDGISLATVKQLEEKNLIESYLDEPDALLAAASTRQQPLTLNDEQQQAFDQLRFNQFNTYLLEGATGSGKTEIYLQAIEHCLNRQRTALVLVPEIGLTPQLVERFERRFGLLIVALHSGLNDRQRASGWILAAAGKVAIVIGTRSAIFTPLPDLGIIIVDEEHDSSFKQQDGFRYSARDLAVVRAQRAGVPLILGSATPSLETLYNSTHNRYLHLRLTQRAGGARAPFVELIDVRRQSLRAGLSPPLIAAIEQTLAAGNQALIFINRRGFAPIMQCHDCGWIAPCNHCSARMTVHQQPPHLHCHHCDHQRPIPKHCPDCRSTDLQYLGLGTEQSEQALQKLFPATEVIRIDRDTTRRKNSLHALLASVHDGKPCILVGTQMLAKGHHFADVTLVAIVDIDAGLFSTDFRAQERMGQLLIQVAGRAGREHKPGKVMIQSHHCEHPNIQSLVKEGYHRYARRLLRERQVVGLPPYRFLAVLRAESKRIDNATGFLILAKKIASAMIAANNHISYLGPLPGMLERKNDRYCFQLHINCSERPLLQKILTELAVKLEAHAFARRCRWSIDVDPQDMA